MSGQVTSVDITSLAQYLEKVKDLSSINKMMGPTYLKYFIEGQDVAGSMLAKAVQSDIKAKAHLDKVESIAYLDKAADYLKERGIKDSSEARKRYVDVDPEVLEAKDHKAKTEALVHLLKSKLSVLRQSHDALKKILYADQSGTAWEGM